MWALICCNVQILRGKLLHRLEMLHRSYLFLALRQSLCSWIGVVFFFSKPQLQFQLLFFFALLPGTDGSICISNEKHTYALTLYSLPLELSHKPVFVTHQEPCACKSVNLSTIQINAVTWHPNHLVIGYLPLQTTLTQKCVVRPKIYIYLKSNYPSRAAPGQRSWAIWPCAGSLHVRHHMAEGAQ